MIRTLTHLTMAGALLCLSTGCASIVTGTHRKVAFNSSPPGAKVCVTDKKDRVVKEGVTPCTFKLLRGKPYFTPKKYTVTFSKEGYWDAKQELKATLNGWYVGNLIFGGLTGLIVVDPLTGAMWMLPKEMSVTLNPRSTAVSGGPELQPVPPGDVSLSGR